MLTAELFGVDQHSGRDPGVHLVDPELLPVRGVERALEQVEHAVDRDHVVGLDQLMRGGCDLRRLRLVEFDEQLQRVAVDAAVRVDAGEVAPSCFGPSVKSVPG